LRLQSGTELATLLMVAVFQMATAPVAAHIIGRSAYRADLVRRDLLVTDEADGITTGATGGDGTGGQRRATI